MLEGTKRRDLRGLFCYLVELDVDKRRTQVTPYYVHELKLAHENYLASERANANFPHRSAVLVTAYSLDEVQKAYPGFYGDTKAFLRSAGLTV